MARPTPNIDTLSNQPSNEFQLAIDEITRRQLSPENIITYADEALLDLIGVVDDVIENNTSMTDLTGKDRELYAFEQAELDPELIEQTLSRISDVAEFTQRLDSIIAAKTKYVDMVITPPDSTASPITPGKGNYEPARTQLRLEAISLLLEMGFGISVESDDVDIKEGRLSPNMMRLKSYRLVKIEGLARAILVCNEVGNKTFVFDLAACLEAGISSDDLMELPKPDLEDLLDSEPTLGSKISYSSKYINNVAVALANPFDEIIPASQSEAELLKPKAEARPEGYRSAKGIAEYLSSSYSTIMRVIDELGDQLGDTIWARFGAKGAIAYSPEQQEIIRMRLEERGLLTKQPAEGYLSTNHIADQLGVDFKTVKKVITELGDQLGDTIWARFGANKAIAYSPDQQEMIRVRLEKKGLLTERPPEGYLSASNIADQLDGKTKEVVKKAIAELGDQLGDTIWAKFGIQRAIAYSPEQQEIIHARLEERGSLIERPPEGYHSINEIADQLDGIWPLTVKLAIDELGDQLGDTIRAKFGSNNAVAYSPDQQEMIRVRLEERGSLAEQPPEGYLPVKGIADRFGIASRTVNLAISKVGDQLGNVIIAKFRGASTFAYSPDQQEMIRVRLEERGSLAEQAPEGYFPIRGIADRLGIASETVKRTIYGLGDQLGNVILGKSGGRTVPVYSPDQQEMIRVRLEEKELLAEQAPEGYFPIQGIADWLGISPHTVKLAIDELGEDQLGSVVYAKYRGAATPAYTPEQQEMIRVRLEERGLLAEQPPEGYLSIKRIANRFGIASDTVKRAISELGDQLGDTIRAKFGPRTVPAYSPEQQEMIVDWIRANTKAKLGKLALSDTA